VIVYVDTSALMKLVRPEEHSAALHGWLGAHDPTLVTSTIGAVELRRAAARVGASTVRVAEAVIARTRLIDAQPATLDLAARLTPPALRTLDAIHLATAVMIGDLDASLCYDRRLGAAFERIGITVEAPEGPA
jgi:hypothetical protein